MSYSLEDLLILMTRLRDPVAGCPWDIQQTYSSIAPSTLEEAYEVVDAIEKKDFPHLKEELGDLLFQVIFYAELGREEGRFDFHEITSALVEKLVRRHPHVFPSGHLNSTLNDQTIDAEQAKVNWEAIKQKERKDQGAKRVLSDVPIALPALTRAAKLQKRAASVGFDWKDVEGPIDKVREELLEVEEAIAAKDMDAVEDELGDLLFAVVNIVRHLKLDPEKALRRANQKFETRFNYIDDHLAGDFREADMEALNRLWDQAKQST